MQKQGCFYSCFRTIQKLRSRWNSLGCCDAVIGDLKAMKTACDYKIAPHSFISNLSYSYIFLIRWLYSYLLPNCRPCSYVYSLMVWVLIKGIQNLSFLAKEKDFLPAIELITVLMALSVVFMAVLLIKYIQLFAYFNLTCIRKLQGLQQKKHLICCFCWKYLAQNDQTGLSLKRKLLSFLNQNLFKKVTELVRQVQEMKSLFVICSFTVKQELNLFFSYLLISVIIFGPNPLLIQKPSFGRIYQVIVSLLYLSIIPSASLEGSIKISGQL